MILFFLIANFQQFFFLPDFYLQISISNLLQICCYLDFLPDFFWSNNKSSQLVCDAFVYQLLLYYSNTLSLDEFFLYVQSLVDNKKTLSSKVDHWPCLFKIQNFELDIIALEKLHALPKTFIAILSKHNNR